MGELIGGFIDRVSSGRIGAGKAAAAFALFAVTVACSGGGSDSSASDAAAERIGIDPEDRCDMGFNTETFNETTELVHHHDHNHGSTDVQIDLAEWADVFVDPALGMTPQEVVDELQTDRTKEFYRLHIEEGVLTGRLGPDPWMPMTDSEQCTALADELSQAREVTEHYPTVDDAEDTGYEQGDEYHAGLGVHYQRLGEIDSEFDPGDPEQLLYDGTDDDSSLVGFSYVVATDNGLPPEGFPGNNDQWHNHDDGWCLDSEGVSMAAEILTPEQCAALGGVFVQIRNWYMLHVWVRPGCESDWGIFSAANPAVSYIPNGEELTPGCNTGKTVDDQLEFDQGELVLR